MKYLNERDTQEKILAPLSHRLDRQGIRVKESMRQYEQLSLPEQEVIHRWILNHLSELPLLSKTKKNGLEQLLAGHYQDPAALLLIRYGFQALTSF